MFRFVIEPISDTPEKISFEIKSSRGTTYLWCDRKGFHCECKFHSIKDPYCKLPCNYIRAVKKTEEYKNWLGG
jgi:hypothetical protein